MNRSRTATGQPIQGSQARRDVSDGQPLCHGHPWRAQPHSHGRPLQRSPFRLVNPDSSATPARSTPVPRSTRGSQHTPSRCGEPQEHRTTRMNSAARSRGHAVHPFQLARVAWPTRLVQRGRQPASHGRPDEHSQLPLADPYDTADSPANPCCAPGGRTQPRVRARSTWPTHPVEHAVHPGPNRTSSIRSTRRGLCRRSVSDAVPG